MAAFQHLLLALRGGGSCPLTHVRNVSSLKRCFRHGLHMNEEELLLRHRLMRVMAADSAMDPSLEYPC